MVTRRTLLKGFAASALVYPALPWRWLAAKEQPASGDLAFLSASRLSELIHRRQIGALELLDLYLDRIQRFNPQLNAVIWLDGDRARSRAREADKALDRGEIWGPLHGLPMTVKDTLEVAGMPTTSGNPIYELHIPKSNAPAVQRLVQAGAVIFGRTNVPQDAGDWQTYNPLHGTTHNPWNPRRTPGGSSGGAAAALAAGLTALELGSDFGGSIRIPAHFSGVYGHKSSFGLIPYEGHIPPPPGVSASPEMAVIGPLARSAEDLELALTVLTKPVRSERSQLPPVRGRRLQDYRVAAWLTDPYSEIDQAVRIPLQRAVEALRRAGVQVNEQARPELTLAESHGVYQGLVQKIFRGYAPPDIAERQQSLRNTWQAFFQDYDVLLAPVAPVVAFPHDHHQPMRERHLLVNGAEVNYLFGLSVWMSLASAAYLPATTAPVGLSPMGLPVGIQIIGPYRGDRSTLAFSRLMSKVVGGFSAPPGY